MYYWLTTPVKTHAAHVLLKGLGDSPFLCLWPGTLAILNLCGIELSVSSHYAVVTWIIYLGSLNS